MLIIFTISKPSFRHVQGTTSRDLWLSLEKAYASHSTSREYTLKTQLMRIEMDGDETPDAYLNHAQEYVDALAAIGEPIKDKDLVMLVVPSLREEYNGLITFFSYTKLDDALIRLLCTQSLHYLKEAKISSAYTADALKKGMGAECDAKRKRTRTTVLRVRALVGSLAWIFPAESENAQTEGSGNQKTSERGMLGGMLIENASNIPDCI
ncbi:nucleotide-binding alpha-beta plait domain-containing protein [Tanacetum coccineum]